MMPKGGVVMSIKHLFFLGLVLAISAGCSVVDRQSSPGVAETPPYLQPRSELAQSQLADMRAFHEKEFAKMAEDLQTVHSREIESIGTAGKDFERDRRWQEDYERTLAQREQQAWEQRAWEQRAREQRAWEQRMIEPQMNDQRTSESRVNESRTNESRVSEPRTSWTSWFKKTDGENKKEAPAVMSSRIGGAHTSVR